MFYTIYKITHKDSGKFYIGMHQTSNLDDGYMGSGKYLRHAQEKYGLNTFEKEILFIFEDHQSMVNKEKELVTEEFCARNDTYNIRKGGKGGFTKESSHLGRINANRKLWNNVEFRKKQSISTSRLNKVLHANGVLKAPSWNGKTHSEETKRKIGESNSIKQSGKNNSQYGLQWITNGVESKKIKKHDPIPEGWKKGRKMK